MGDLEKRIKRIRKALEECRRAALNVRNVQREEILKFKLQRLEEQQNLYWRQRAKVHWLENGDRNTKFFHHYATERKKKSRIQKLVKEDGVVVEQGEEIKTMISNFYNDLFTSHAGGHLDVLLQHVSSKVTET